MPGLPACAAAVGIPGAGAGAPRRLTGAVLPPDPPAASAISSQGLDRRISASRPGMGAAGGISGHGARRRARMPAASGLAVARRDAAPVQGRRAATSTSSSLCCDDDQDAVGERPQAGVVAAVCRPGKVRNSLCSVAAGSVRRHPDYEDLVAPGRKRERCRAAGTAGPARQRRYEQLARPVPVPGAAVACRRGSEAAGRGLVSPPRGASRPAAGASLA